MLTITKSTLPAESATPSLSTGMERRPQGREAPASVSACPPSRTLAGPSGYLWCPECEEVVEEPGSRDCGGLVCDVCNSNLVDTHACLDCGKAVGSPEDDWCIGCLAKWAARERADELRSALIDIATPWRKTA